MPIHPRKDPTIWSWELAIRSFKTHLRRIMGNVSSTDYRFDSDIKAWLNSWLLAILWRRRHQCTNTWPLFDGMATGEYIPIITITLSILVMYKIFFENNYGLSSIFTVCRSFPNRINILANKWYPGSVRRKLSSWSMGRKLGTQEIVKI